MANRNILDFRAQAEQMMRIIEHRLKQNQRAAGVDFLILKFKALYEQGVSSVAYTKKKAFILTRFTQEKDL